mgnify:CR=1 FL=1
MKALILNNKVVDVKEEEFKVTSSMFWIDCPDDTKIGFKYDGENFISNQPTAEQIAEQEQAIADKINKKASGKQKLLDLGLTEEEVKALIGA